jgi:serine/threonine protein kinase/Flp pilus assembly protein TadD
MEFRREYLVRLPLPLAQLYSRAHNAKDARSRHDNAFYLCEALIKLAATPLIASYHEELRQGRGHVAELDELLAQLALPSLGQWMALLRELARHFGSRPDAASHPLGHLWDQLSTVRRDRPGLAALYRRIKNGVDGQPAGDQHCSVLQALEGLVQYRNAVFGHGGPRFESFFEKEMGPLLFPGVNELLEKGSLDFLGPKGSRLAYITDLRQVEEQRHEAGVRELVGLQSERQAPLALTGAQVQGLLPNRVCVLWPGRPTPLRLEPLLVYRETETAEEVLFLNRDRNGKQTEYLSYTTGSTERDKAMVPALKELLGRVSGRSVTVDNEEESVGQEGSEPSVGETIPATGVDTGGQVIGDYELLAELGHGGMGVVYLARQLSMGRLVALKMLTGELAGDEKALTRFRREIRHLASCDHPNIIKVLASGTLSDGRLYFAMEYIAGCDLDAVWRELADQKERGPSSSLGHSHFSHAILSSSRKHREKLLSRAEATRGGRGNPSTVPGIASADVPSRQPQDAALPILPELPVPQTVTQETAGGYLRRVADIVRQAALALESVHQRHVVHRDIKPANLMLTADGTRVVLMDFGLAKGDSVALTAGRQGGFLGTLRYAAPEQLAASLVDVGPAADVRALGGVLWELVTRRRLFDEAQDEAQLAIKVMTEDVPRLRQIDPAVDRDLEAIVARATERDLNRRIKSAGQLAEYLSLYLEGKPIPIRTPSTREVLWRWVKAHKERVGLVAALILLLLGGITWGIVNQYDRLKRDAEHGRKQALLDQQIHQALEQSTKTRNELQETLHEPGGVQKLLNDPTGWGGDLKEARAACQRARALWESGEDQVDPDRLSEIESLEALLQTDERDYRLALELDRIRMDLATVVEGKQELDRAADSYAKAFEHARLPVDSGKAETLAAEIKKSAVPGQIVAALDHWAWISFAQRRHAKKAGTAELAQKKESLWKQLLQVARLADPGPWKDEVRDPGVWEDTPRLKKLVEGVRQELEKQSLTIAFSPAMLELVGSLLEPADTDRVLLLRAAQAKYPADFRLNLLLGQTLLSTSHPEEGVGFYQAAVALRPKNPVVYNNFGVALRTTRNYRGALAAYDRAVALDNGYALALTNKGNVLQDLEQLDAAIAAHEQAIRFDPRLSQAHRNLGNALVAQKKYKEAATAYQKALEFDPNAPGIYNQLGLLYLNQKKWEEANIQFHKAIDLQPKEPIFWNNLGAVAQDQKKWKEAEQFYNKALEVSPKYPKAHQNLAQICREHKDWDGAVAHLRTAISLDSKVESNYTSLASLLLSQDDAAGAAAVYRQALDITPKSAFLHESLGKALVKQEYLNSAVDEFRKATEIDPKRDSAFTLLGAVLRTQKKWPDAMAAYEKALALTPKSAPAQEYIGLIFSDQKKYAEAAACYHKAIALNEKYTPAHHKLGYVLRRQGKFTEALESYRKAKSLGGNVGDWITNCERFIELDPRLPDLLHGKVKPRDAAERILIAQLCADKGQFADSLQSYIQAFAEDPKLAEVYPNRYNSACYAALLAAASDSAMPRDAAEKLRLRQQAMGFLKAEWATWHKQFTADPAKSAGLVRQRTDLWLRDEDLVSVREPTELARLSGEERSTWLEYWASVKALNQLAREYLQPAASK